MAHTIRVFISHAPEDGDAADRLYRDLETAGMRPWMAGRDLLAGQDRAHHIRGAIRESAFFIALLSNRSVTKKGSVHGELRAALEILDDHPDGEIFVIPARLDDCGPSNHRLENIQSVDLFPDYAAGVDRILRSLSIRTPDICRPSGPICVARVFKSGWTYARGIHFGDPASACEISGFQLHEKAKIRVGDKTCKLGALCGALRESGSDAPDIFHEGVQCDMGEFLFDGLFGTHAPQGRKTDLRIVTNDPHVGELPWMLLARKRTFVTAEDWRISVSTTDEVRDADLPQSPRLLVAVFGTGADIRIEDLEDRLSARNATLMLGSGMRVAGSPEEFESLVREFEPHVVYFSGHCEQKAGDAILCFGEPGLRATPKLPVRALAKTLKKVKTPPLLVYINAVGHTGGWFEPLAKISETVPAVIAGRHLPSLDTAQEQARVLLEEILTSDVSPHRAVSFLHRKADGHSRAQARWMTPFILRNYGQWRSARSNPPSRKIHDPFWHLKIDRVKQFGVVSHQTAQMLMERKPKSLAFVWYGTQGQGMSTFHHRLDVELREYLIRFRTAPVVVRPDWPDDMDRPEISFENRMKEAFGVGSLEDVPGAIRAMSRGVSGNQTLVYVRHRPVTSTLIINPATLRTYLSWWDETFVPLLGNNQFALLGVSFVVKNPPKFHGHLVKDEKLDDMDMEHTVLRILDEMEKLARRDLRDFLKTHRIKLPDTHKDRIIGRILEKTGGHYEKTVQQLRALVNQNCDAAADEPKPEKKKETGYDY